MVFSCFLKPSVHKLLHLRTQLLSDPTTPFSPIIITEATRGQQQTIDVITGHIKLPAQTSCHCNQAGWFPFHKCSKIL